MYKKVSCTVAAILGGVSMAAFAEDTGGGGAGSLEEIIVTAQRRSENMQNVPISMQAFTSESLKQLNITTFDDYVKYLPNVSSANNGPGQNEIFMRGLSAGQQPSQGSGSTASFPNVAIYLDNQSGQLPGRNLDVYAADINRIEVLEGPQGTLFGSGAEAGMIRYITNEPKLDVTEGNVKFGYGTTAHGAPNSSGELVFNLPLVEGRAALRLVAYEDRRGGYIDNVPATFTRRNTDVGIAYAHYPAVNGQCPDGLPNNGFCVPPGSPSVNNSAFTGSDINPATYQGLRAGLKLKFNEDWDLLITQMYQELNADGVFYQQPYGSDREQLQPLQVTLFNPSFDRDKFTNTAWTLNGKLGELRAVYTGGYLSRKVEQVNDYTNYSRGVYADYYQCYGPGAFTQYLPSKCFSPQVIWRSNEQNQHTQHEFRLSTPDDWRFRALGGVYIEDNKLYDQSDWRYKTVPACTSSGTPGVDPGNTGCFTPIGTSGGNVVNPGVRDANSSFYQDDVREVKQTAFFISADYDLIPKVLTATLGTRHYQFKNSLKGDVPNSFFCFQAGAPGATGCQANSYHLDQHNPPLRDTEEGWKSRANLTWHVTPDVMVYYTFSQGFRPGGFNQNGGALHGYDQNQVYQYKVPDAYRSDKLDNNEIGWKTQWFNHRLEFNGAYYQEKWKDVQVAIFYSSVVGNVFFNSNGQDFDLKGLEMQLVARPWEGWTIQAAGSWNHSEQTNSPQLLNNNDVTPSPSLGQPITYTCGGTYFTAGCTAANAPAVANVYGPKGSPTANSPPIQTSVRIRYDWFVNDLKVYWQVGSSHVGHSFTQAGSNPPLAADGLITTSRIRFDNPAYTTVDAAIGCSRGNWNVALVGENLADSNKAVFTSTDQFIVAQTPLRPRVISLNVGLKF
ncbi:MAG: TonB-dependent receptor [Gammaproteobacteria bacterium]|nr:TonB-dependent receptor [Gammaproteobacteria bacterium]